MSNELWLPIAATAAIAVAFSLGVFSPKTVAGPCRLSEGESSAVVFRVLWLALLTWALCILGLGALHQASVKRHGQPASTGLSNQETVLYGAATEAAVMASMLLGTIALRRNGIRRLGIAPRRIPAGVLTGILGIAIVLPLIIYVDVFTQLALSHWRQVHPPHELLEVLKDHPPAWLQAAAVISAGIIAPLAEEIFFRGLLQTLFRNVLNRPWPAVVLSAAAFALVHHWWTWPQIFFLGLCLGYAYERTGNLWVSITMHATFNLTSIWLFTQWG